MMIRHFFLLLFSCVTFLSASEVNVAAAANLTYALKELKTAFLQTHPQAHLRFTISGSGKLATQISRGAPYDIFLSANTAYVQKLYDGGKTLQKPRVYAKGALVMLSVKERDFSKGLALLKDDTVYKIAIANPKTAPYGKASVEALKNSGLYEALKPKFVYAESISQTLLYTLKAADVGLIAKSALFAPTLRRFKEGKNYIEIDSKLYTPIAQGAALLHHAKNNASAQAFYAFLFSAKAKKIFENYGYKVER